MKEKHLLLYVFLLIILMMKDWKMFTVKGKAIENLYTREKASQDTVI